jgi:hypothetical protein
MKQTSFNFHPVNAKSVINDVDIEEGVEFALLKGTD